MQEYTAICLELEMNANQAITEVSLRRIKRLEGETIADMLKRQNLQRSTVYLLHGHPCAYSERY